MAKPIIPWIGGKSRFKRKIVPMFAEHTCYVEPFAGGAALFFYKTPVAVEVLNDINGELVNLYRVIQHHLEEFVRQFKWSLVSREEFNILRETPAHVLTDIQRAARFYYIQKMSFGGKVESPTFGTATTAPPRLNYMRLEEDLSAAHLRLSRAYIENRPWAKCIESYDRPHTQFFLDPPYFGTTGYGVDFGLDEYDKMATLAKTCKGKMLITVNDIPEMRKAFKGLEMEQLSINYTVGGGQSKKISHELLIRNY